MKTVTMQSVLQRHQQDIAGALRHVLAEGSQSVRSADMHELASFYEQMRYHLGLVDENFTPTSGNVGKLLRPTLLLLAYELAGAGGMAEQDVSPATYLQRALPAALAIELAHNFSLIHDDIEDGDEQRRHRPTLWKLWGIPHAVNTGDGMYALSRLVLWNVLSEGVEPAIVVQLGIIFDRSLLQLTEGQYLDMSFEDVESVAVPLYMRMIERKTAIVMGCAAEMGALLGTSERKTIESLRDFGRAIGLAFQVRDDILGVWATRAELGKTAAGDIIRRKKSLPILHALQHSNAADQQTLRAIYQQTVSVTQEQVEQVLAIFVRAQARRYCCDFLAQQCQVAREALRQVPVGAGAIAKRARAEMDVLIDFIAKAAQYT